jgi:hypothetical protein
MSTSSTNAVLCWPSRLLAEEDLRRHLTSQREIVLGTKTIVTPLALDFLKGKRVAIRRDDKAGDKGVSMGTWGIAVEAPSPVVAAAIQALLQDGRMLTVMEYVRGDVVDWIRSIAHQVVQRQAPGAVVVSEQPSLAACIANKVPGMRAASVSQTSEIGALKAVLSPNLFALTAAGRTFFELRQMLKLATASPPACPESTAKVLKELDGHAHR